MGKSVICATIDLLLENLLALARDSNFNDDLGELKQSVVMIRDFLEDAESKQLVDRHVRRWLLKLETVAFDADFILDEHNYHVLREKVQRDVKMEKNVSSWAFRHKMARKIKYIKNELKPIYKEAKKLGILQDIVSASYGHGVRTETPAYLEKDRVYIDSVFIGRENEVTKVVEMLTSSRLTEENISVYPIFGMGGLGKTTLARKVFNDVKIVSHFREGERIWVHVPVNFDPITVLKMILESLTGEYIDGSRDFVLRKLGEKLGDKKYLLVIDNVWNAEYEIWDNFVYFLKAISRANGSVIMVTTRKTSVASIVKTLDVDELEGLSNEDCWSIIKANAFEGEYVPSEFETIGKNIAQRCGGLPFSAQVVGSLLRGRYKDDWVSIEKNWISEIGGNENPISKVLKLSFDNLPSTSLKKCFALCSIFPKGWCMEKNEMIQLWMAEGLVQTNDEENMEYVGNQMFDELVQSSLIQVRLRDSYGNAKQYILNDLLHDIASSALNPEFSNNACQHRYLSIPFEDESSRSPNKYVGVLRALFFSNDVSQLMLSKMKRLHILILNDRDVKELPIEIGNLISLRYLDISLTRIEYLPDSVGDLCHLQTLRVAEEHGAEGYLKNMPDTFKYLINLRHLYIPNIKLPPGIGNLISLQTLPYFQVGDEEGCRIVELGKLRKVRGEIEIDNLEKVGGKEEAKSVDLLYNPNISKLKLVWNGRSNNDEDVLEGLQPHSNLKVLEIEGFKGRSFPLWTSRMAVRKNLEDRWVMLDNLLEIKLSGCKECKDVPMLGHLPHLKFLYLHHLSTVKSLGYAFYGIEQNVQGYERIVVVFPKLEKLELIAMENLLAWEEVCIPQSSYETQPREVSLFPRLEYLKISNCMELTSAPSIFPCLKELEIVNMKSGMALTNIFGSKLTTLVKFKIDGVEELVCLPDQLFSNNPDLKDLEIRNCPLLDKWWNNSSEV